MQVRLTIGHDHQRTNRVPVEFARPRYVLMHSLAHLLITAVSLECGYPASAIRERVSQELARTGLDEPCPERGRHAVIVDLADRIELVVVAAGAPDRHPQECGTRGVDHVLEPLVLVFLGVIRLVVPGAQSKEAGRDDGRLVAVGEFVARELLDDEAVKRLVLIERADHPVAIFPRMGLGLISLVAAGLGVAGHVEPVTSPALAVMWRGEEAVH